MKKDLVDLIREKMLYHLGLADRLNHALAIIQGTDQPEATPRKKRKKETLPRKPYKKRKK